MRAFFTIGFLAAMTLPARAEGSVSIVVPNRPDVPIIINGVDASWAVVEGDWGLARGVHVQPTVYGGRPVEPEPRVGRYFPSAGQAPGYGRLEIEPPTRRPRRAESYYRSWTSQSEPPRAQEQQPAPPIVVETTPNDPAQRRRRYR